MLILRRKAGETLLIGDEIKVTVLDINEGSVRLAIDAPRRITILRSELVQAADANRDAASGQSPALLKLLERGPGDFRRGRPRPGGTASQGLEPSAGPAAGGPDTPGTDADGKADTSGTDAGGKSDMSGTDAADMPDAAGKADAPEEDAAG